MRITAVTPIVLRLPEVTAACDGTQDTCLIRIDTDAGITGWGEVDSAPTVVRAIVQAPLSHQLCAGLAHALIGADPLAIEVCHARMLAAANYYGRTGAGRHAMAGIDIALWDIAGKARACPVAQLLGGPFQDRFRPYCSVLFPDTPAATYDEARRRVDQGFTAIKFGWGPMGQEAATDVALVAQARRGAGDAVDIMVDAGQAWDWRTALARARAFADHRILWLEEPLAPDDLDGYARLCAASPVPIAAGEAESRLEDFEALLRRGQLDWVQPDPGRCGLSTMVQVGRLAWRCGRCVVNHSFKSGITLAASLHALSACPRAELCEYCMSPSPLRHELTEETFPLVDGWIRLPSGPGLGVTIVEATIERYRAG